jgi:carboxymethylenebutenolidase
LTPHIEDVTRRLALEGFFALAPDLLSPGGGTPADADLARQAIGKLEPEVTLGNLAGAIAHLKKHPECNGKVGAVGFCWGGGMVGQLAAHAPQLDAGVVYYGRQPDPASVPEIQAPLLLHYAELDERVNAGIPAFRAALDAAKKTYTLHIYAGAQHAFNNDTSTARYDKKTADLAWSRTVEFLHQHLKS